MKAELKKVLKDNEQGPFKIHLHGDETLITETITREGFDNLYEAIIEASSWVCTMWERYHDCDADGYSLEVVRCDDGATLWYENAGFVLRARRLELPRMDADEFCTAVASALGIRPQCWGLDPNKKPFPNMRLDLADGSIIEWNRKKSLIMVRWGMGDSEYVRVGGAAATEENLIEWLKLHVQNGVYVIPTNGKPFPNMRLDLADGSIIEWNRKKSLIMVRWGMGDSEYVRVGGAAATEENLIEWLKLHVQNGVCVIPAQEPNNNK